jgi:hypothetical protein
MFLNQMYEQVKAGMRVAEIFQLGLVLNKNLLKIAPRFNSPFIVTTKVDRGAVFILLQDVTETVANLDHLRVFKRQHEAE